ncbi:uncharacterized protein LOC112572480 [Pomacea canaliculata]|uniref:uncharacterized protein LOC112572480 n=1 Tax=Pomacea canaliculata TaxID=400727 RepID=UPI000D73B0DA|nr:uncharacterized protein LOC112572480 [Pomacea canaliculata]
MAPSVSSSTQNTCGQVCRNLCNNVDKVEAGSECMNNEMNRGSECKRRAYNMIKPGAHQTMANSTSTFITQCRFFRALVECQRVAVSTSCSTDLGDLHADFLLSFVPDTCLDSATLDAIGLQESKGQLSDLLLGKVQGQGPEDENKLRQLVHGKVKGGRKSPEVKKPKATEDAPVEGKDTTSRQR